MDTNVQQSPIQTSLPQTSEKKKLLFQKLKIPSFVIIALVILLSVFLTGYQMGIDNKSVSDKALTKYMLNAALTAAPYRPAQTKNTPVPMLSPIPTVMQPALSSGSQITILDAKTLKYINTKLGISITFPKTDDLGKLYGSTKDIFSPIGIFEDIPDKKIAIADLIDSNLTPVTLDYVMNGRTDSTGYKATPEEIIFHYATINSDNDLNNFAELMQAAYKGKTLQSSGNYYDVTFVSTKNDSILPSPKYVVLYSQIKHIAIAYIKPQGFQFADANGNAEDFSVGFLK